MLHIHNATLRFIILCAFCQMSAGVWYMSDIISPFEHGNLSLFEISTIEN